MPSTPSPNPILPALVAPLPADEFLSSYWPFRPLVAAPLPDRAAALLAAPELQNLPALLKAHRGRTRAVFTLPSGQYREAPITPDAAQSLFDAGMTICLSSVELCISVVASWVRGLAADLRLGRLGQVSCSAYVSPAGRGFAKHCDDHEVFVVQLWGRKRWRIAENHDVPFPAENYVPANGRSPEIAGYLAADAAPAMPADAALVEMSPGSALFLPRGYWHETDAEEYSLSLTFGIHVPSYMEVVLAALRRRLLTSPEWRRPAVVPGAEAGPAAIASRLAERLSDLAGAVHGLAPLELAAALLPSTAPQFHRVPGHALVVDDGAGPDAKPTATILRDGREATRIVCDPALVAAMRAAADRQTPFGVADLVAGGVAERAAAMVVLTLVKAGFLQRLDPGA